MQNHNSCYSKRLNIISKFPIADFFLKAISSFFDTTSGTMNTDDHLFIYLSNCLFQTQPDGVFQNQINFRLIHSGPTPVPWFLTLRHQPHWWKVVNSEEHRFHRGDGTTPALSGVTPTAQTAMPSATPRVRPAHHLPVSAASCERFL